MGELQQWPDDPEFRRFAAKLADAVMLAQSRGYIIGTEGPPNCCCPLGVALVPGDWSHPGSLTASRAWGLKYQDAAHFIDGFDAVADGNQGSPYNRLGRAYRERFVTTNPSSK